MHAAIPVVPSVAVESSDGSLAVRLSGGWVQGASLPDPAGVFESAGGGCASVRPVLDEGAARDSTVCIYLLGLHAASVARGIRFDDSALPADLRKLMELARAVKAPEEAEEEAERYGLLAIAGAWGLDFWRDFKSMCEFLGDWVQGVLSLVRGSTRIRKGDFLQIFQSCTVQALPIVVLISLLVGVIISFLGGNVLSRFAAQSYVSYLVGFGMLRELGALMTAVIMAGRTGAAYAAEIGTMKVNGEIDALEVTGVRPRDFIVMPRILALTLAMPLLTLFANAIGIISGQYISDVVYGIMPAQFWDGVFKVTEAKDLLVGLVKALFFGFGIAYAGCSQGMACGKDAGSVGLAATKSVVRSITLIVVLNALIDTFCAFYGI